MRLAILLVGSGNQTSHARNLCLSSGFDVQTWAGKSRHGHSEAVAILLLIAESGSVDMAGTLARQICEAAGPIPVLAMAPDSSESLAIAVFRGGVSDYFRTWEELRQGLLVLKHGALPARSQASDEGRMVGEAPCMRQLADALERVAASSSNVLITGETGTGKDLAAEYIHRHSVRRAKPMIGMNCAAIPDALLESELFGYERGAFTGANVSLPGKLRLADGGTVFLDEVGDMNIYAQAKILRVVDTRSVHPLGSSRAYPVDIRIVAATNQDLETLMRQGRFRADLYYRLNVARIHLPPLRERKADMGLLVDYYLRLLNSVFKRHVVGLTEEALLAALAYHWPGNIRELKNALESAYLQGFSETLSLSELPPPLRAIAQKAQDGKVGDEPRMLAALAETNWNKSKAARKLDWSRMTLYRKMAKYEIGRPKAQSA